MWVFAKKLALDLGFFVGFVILVVEVAGAADVLPQTVVTAIAIGSAGLLTGKRAVDTPGPRHIS